MQEIGKYKRKEGGFRLEFAKTMNHTGKLQENRSKYLVSLHLIIKLQQLNSTFPQSKFPGQKCLGGVVYIRFCDTKFGYNSWFAQMKIKYILKNPWQKPLLTKLFIKVKCQSL